MISLIIKKGSNSVSKFLQAGGKKDTQWQPKPTTSFSDTSVQHSSHPTHISRT